MSRYTDSGRITHLITNVGAFPQELVERLSSAQLSLSTEQTSQLTVVVSDPDLELLKQNFLAPGLAALALGSPPAFFQVRSREMVSVGNVLGLSVIGRSETIATMQGFRGPLIRANITPTDYVRYDVAAAGYTLGRIVGFVGQPSAARDQILRVQDANTDDSAWDVALRLATELGYYCFEAGDTVYFGQPSWLLTQIPSFYARWRGKATTDPLIGPPLMRRSLDDSTAGATGTLTVHNEGAEAFIPGGGVQIGGLGPFDGLYLIKSLTLDLDGKSPATVTVETPTDPAPQPAATSSQGDGFAANYHSVETSTVSDHGLSYPVAGEVRGSTASGVTIYAQFGDAVLSPGAGTVSKVAPGAGDSGWKVRIYHGFGVSTEITHLASTLVGTGQAVGRGQKVGTVGQSGRTDAYVHVQVFVGNNQVTPTDYLPAVT